MALASSTSNSSTDDNVQKIRRKCTSQKSLLLRRWESSHPNPLAGQSVYCTYKLQKMFH